MLRDLVRSEPLRKLRIYYIHDLEETIEGQPDLAVIVYRIDGEFDSETVRLKDEDIKQFKKDLRLANHGEKPPLIDVIGTDSHPIIRRSKGE